MANHDFIVNSFSILVFIQLVCSDYSRDYCLQSVLENRLLNEEKIYSERFKKKISDRIEQSKKQTMDDIQKLALNISIKSIKDLLNKEKEIKDNQLNGKSIAN